MSNGIQENESTDKGDGQTPWIRPKALLDNGIPAWGKSRQAGRILVADSMLHTGQQRTRRISRQYRKMEHVLEGNHMSTQTTLLLSWETSNCADILMGRIWKTGSYNNTS